MKVLVTGYACDPYRGSEPGVGWRAVCRIARSHDVFVLTDVHNMEGWQRAERQGEVPGNVRVRFLRKPTSTLQNRWLAHLQSWKNCSKFNGLVLDAARAWHAEVGFDLCHQVTVAGWRLPSPLWQLPVPFVWGPIGGAGVIPREFRKMLSPSGRLMEAIRDVNTSWSSRSRAFRNCMRGAAWVFAANEETETFLRPFRAGHPMKRLPIASIPEETALRFARPAGSRSEGPLRLFAGGNMEGRKGVALALRAVAVAKDRGLALRYTVAGGGPDLPNLIALRRELGLEEEVEFHPGFSGDDYVKALHAADVYFLPSFRESTPVTLLEACLAGCYPVVADTSAQGEIVRLVGGSAVPTESVEQLVDGLAAALIWCHEHPEEVRRIAANAATEVARHFASTRYDDAIAEAYRLCLAARMMETPSPADAAHDAPPST